MAVGNLNVSVTASTSQARKEIEGLRTSVKGLATTVAGAKMTLDSLHIDEIGRTFYFPKEAMREGLREAEMFRSKVVDLSAETQRYNRVGLGQVGTLKSMSNELKMATRVAKDFAKVGASVVATALVSFKVGNIIGEYAFGVRSLADDFAYLKGKAASAWESVFDLDPRLTESKSQKAAARAAGIEAAKEKAKAEAEAKAKLDAEFASRVRASGMDLAEARGLNVDRQYDDDTVQFGQARAIELMRRREAVVEAERRAEAEKLAKERQLDAMKERQRKYEEDQERRLKNRMDDEKVIAELRRDVAEFWMTDVERERAALMRTLEDPRLRNAAAGLFQMQDIQRQVKEAADARADDAETIRNRRPVDLLDARTSEGWQALRANLKSGPQQQLVAVGNKQLTELQRQSQILEQLIDKSGIGFDPFL
jgi:hypothetical protein